MYEKKAFEAELTKLWAKILSNKPSWYKVGTKALEISDAWEMYQNARQSTLSELLLGDVKLRSQIEVLKNFGTTSGTETTMERKTLKDSGNKPIFPNDVKSSQQIRLGKGYTKELGVAHIRRGSVLNDGWWWTLKNDAWVLGGVHGLKRFHLTMGSVPDDLIWDSKAGRPRVLGRELVGLAAAGYSLIGVPSWAIQSPTRTEVAKSKEPSKVTFTTTPVSSASVRDAIGMVFAPQNADTASALTLTTYYDALAKVKSIDDIKGGILGKEVAYEKYDFAKI